MALGKKGGDTMLSRVYRIACGVSLILFLLSVASPNYAHLIDGVEAGKFEANGQDGVRLKIRTDVDTLVEIIIGQNKITFQARKGELLDTGHLRISGDTVFVKLLEDDGQSPNECEIPVNEIPADTFKRFCFDQQPPRIDGTPSPRPNSFGWNNSTVTVTVRADDEEGGSGIKEIRYKIGTSSEVVVGRDRLNLSQNGRVATTSLQLSSNGEHSISFWAVDQAGNVSERRTLTIKIDTIKPTVTVNLNRTSIFRGDSIQVTITASDNLSGIDSITARDSNLGSISLQRSGDQWRGTISPSSSGRVTATVEDRAGNSNSDSASYSVEARPAFFDVTDLTVSPGSPEVGQSVTIRATIKNTGETIGTKAVTLYIDGVQKDTRSLTLGAGQSDSISFSYSFSLSGTFTVKVSTPDDSRSTTVTVQARPAYFDVSSCSIPSSANVNQSVSFSARITNTGGSSGSQYVRLVIDGSRVDYRYVSLGPGSSETVYLRSTFSYTGSYSVRIESDNDYCSDSIRISRPSSPPWVTYANASSVTGSLSGNQLFFDIPITVYFEDPDGDVTTLIVEGWHSSGAYLGQDSFNPGVYGYTSGSIQRTITFWTPNSTTYCEGYFLLRFTLRDAAGNTSNSYDAAAGIYGCVG